MAYPRNRRSRAHKTIKRTAGNYTLTPVGGAPGPFTVIDAALDLVLAAQIGDVLEVHFSALVQPPGTTGFGLNACSMVGGAAVNNYAPGTYGHGSWWHPAGSTLGNGTPIFYTVVSGDISGGNVTTRIRYTTDGSGNTTLWASGSFPLEFTVKNLGPPAR